METAFFVPAGLPISRPIRWPSSPSP